MSETRGGERDGRIAGRLRLLPTAASHLSGLQRLFASNLPYLRMAGEIATRIEELPPDHAAHYVAAETSLPGGRCLVAIVDSAVVATVALLVPHPQEPYPWLGLLLVDGRSHRRGLGSRVAAAVEASLAQEGWQELRLAVLTDNPGAQSFWSRQGYRNYADATDTRGRPCVLMRKELSTTPP